LIFKCGGCRCNAVAYSGNFLGEDPLCPFSPEELIRAINLNQATKKITTERTDAYLSEINIRNDTRIVKLVTLATWQGDSLIIRNEARNTFVELTGDASNIYCLIPSQCGIALNDLRLVFKKQTGRELPLGELRALISSGVLGCVIE
jgi:hypothetical protein